MFIFVIVIIEITMTYIVRQKINGKTYAYEAKGEWDPVKKNSRQKRRYIGRVDENGNIIPKGSSIQITRVDGAYDFGDVFLVLRVSEDLKLDSILSVLFRKDHQRVLLLAASRLIMPGAMRMVNAWLSRTYLDVQFPDKGISTILSKIGRMSREFTTAWLRSSQPEGAIYFDVTSLESYGTKNRFLEYGYSRAHRDMEQVNLGLVMGRSTRPLFYDVYPGSIPDVKTLLNILSTLKRNGITDVTLVLDRGFYASYNIRELLESGFIMPLPFKTREAMQILKTCRNLRAEDARMHDHSLIYTRSGTFNIDDVKMRYIYYFDPEREAVERKKFFERLTEIESEIEGIKDITRVDEIAGRYGKYISVRKGLIVVRKNKAIARRLSRMGRIILITNKDMKWDEALDLYRSRDSVEKGFRDMKTELGALPMGVHSDDTMQGYLLIEFISLIMESELRRRMRESPLKGKMSLHEMLLELSKLRVIRQGDSRLLTEISKKQREIFEAMKMNQKDLVIN
jgi:transposase